MPEAEELPEETPGYVAPKKVDLDTLKNLDADDEALNKWKASLLSEQADSDPNDTRCFIGEKLILQAEDRDDIELDLGNAHNDKNLKDKRFIIKEGCEYQLNIQFRVQREIVSGLKYLQVVYRKGVRVDKSEYMVGSYGPRKEPYTYKGAVEEAPAGMLARGTYTVKSKFIDDDKNVHLAWDWSFAIKKDWKDTGKDDDE
eukprot:Clim_evm57s225 gene=Clim_evmTU57s225